MKRAQADGSARAQVARPAGPAPHPIFDALIVAAMRAPREELRSTDEVARELGITEEERAAARARIAQWEPDAPDELDNGAETATAEDRAADDAHAQSLIGRE